MPAIPHSLGANTDHVLSSKMSLIPSKSAIRKDARMRLFLRREKLFLSPGHQIYNLYRYSIAGTEFR